MTVEGVPRSDRWRAGPHNLRGVPKAVALRDTTIVDAGYHEPENLASPAPLLPAHQEATDSVGGGVWCARPPVRGYAPHRISVRPPAPAGGASPLIFRRRVSAASIGRRFINLSSSDSLGVKVGLGRKVGRSAQFRYTDDLCRKPCLSWVVSRNCRWRNWRP